MNENDVTVHYWASARSAAGIAEEHVPPGTLADLLDEISRRHRDRDRFDDVISTCSILVGDTPVGAREAGHDLAARRGHGRVPSRRSRAASQHASAYWHHAGVPRLGSTLLSLALAGAITLAAYTDPVFVGAAVLLVQVLIALAPSAVDPSGRSIRSPHFVAALSGGVVATVITLAPDLLNGADGTSADVVGATDNGMMAGILPAIAVSVFVALIAQMLRTDGRPDLVPSTAYAVTLGAFAALRRDGSARPSPWARPKPSLSGPAASPPGCSCGSSRSTDGSAPRSRSLPAQVAELRSRSASTRPSRGSSASRSDLLRPLFGVLGQVLGRAWSRGRTHASAGWGFPGCDVDRPGRAARLRRRPARGCARPLRRARPHLVCPPTLEAWLESWRSSPPSC